MIGSGVLNDALSLGTIQAGHLVVVAQTAGTSQGRE